MNADLPPLNLWAATSPLLPEAIYHRHWARPHQHGSLLTSAWQAQVAAQEDPEFLVSGSALREPFTHIRLFHVRHNRCLIPDETLEQQGPRNGDVLVLLQPLGSTVLDDATAFVRLQGFPSSWPSNVPDDIVRATGRDLRQEAEAALAAERGPARFEIHFGRIAVVTNSFISAKTNQDRFNTLQ